MVLSHEDYKKAYLGKRVDFDWYPPDAPYQCVDLARHYCLQVRWLHTNHFGWSAYTWWINRLTTFPWKKTISGFSVVPVGSVVILKPWSKVKVKKPGAWFWSTERLTEAWHVAIVDYIDDSWTMRLLEQNGATGNGDWLWGNAIRLWWYGSKDSVVGFILQ